MTSLVAFRFARIGANASLVGIRNGSIDLDLVQRKLVLAVEFGSGTPAEGSWQ